MTDLTPTPPKFSRTPTPDSRSDPTLRLAAFDLDGTLKAVRSPYGHVHRALDVEPQAARIYERYQRGELSYEQWGNHEIALWRDLEVTKLVSIVRAIPYWPGARTFLGQLQSAGVHVALISAGFDLHVRPCADELGVTEVFCNRLGVRNGRLTGEFHTDVHSHNKGELLQSLQERYQVSRRETLAAGDTNHDVLMFQQANLAIAVAPADPAVARTADLILADGDWRGAWDRIETLRPGWLPGLGANEDR